MNEERLLKVASVAVTKAAIGVVIGGMLFAIRQGLQLQNTHS
jgi:uncharacterized MnhB-related membrane protein